MAGASVTISPNLLDVVDDLEEKMSDLSTPLAAFGEYLTLITREDRFDKEQDPEGRPWKKLTPKYKQWKSGTPEGHRKKLVFSGTLRDSFVAQVDRKGMTFGSNLIYAATHQFGRGAIPARPMIGVTDEDTAELKALIEDYLIA